MKVIMQSRVNFNSLPGGDTIQLTKTKNELEKLGIEVDINLELKPNLKEYDIVHLSNLTRIQETYIQCKNAVAQGKPIALSTIFWPMGDFEKNGQIGIRKMISKLLNIDSIERIKAIVRYIIDKNSRNEATRSLIKVGYTKMQKYVIENTDIFLPNAEMEMDKLCEYFNLDKNKLKYIVIPNAIDDNLCNIDLDNEKYKEYKDYIICVGRIEPRKNQLSLVKALEHTNYKLLLVGTVTKNHKNYFKKIKKYLDKNKNFKYIEKIPNEELYKIYSECRVSTLPSWLDTPGLVSLEAGVMGCNLAISTRGTTKEYFKNYAYYCEPDDIKSIRDAIDKAYNANKNDKLKKEILNTYTWENAARKTLDGYRKLLRLKQNKHY